MILYYSNHNFRSALSKVDGKNSSDAASLSPIRTVQSPPKMQQDQDHVVSSPLDLNLYYNLKRFKKN